MSNTTVVIKTIGRDTLTAAVASSKREGFTTFVIADGVHVEDTGADRVIKLGRRFGYYGGMCANVGAALVETEFITFLDDDDEFIPGAGDVIRAKLKEKPAVDVWIGGVRFTQDIHIQNPTTGESLLQSRDLATNGNMGVVPGNVAMPTYRTSVFSKLPFSDTVPPTQDNLTDFLHIQMASMAGFSVDWFGEVIYLVRPVAGGVNGGGR